jgi:hypothetical protein
MMVASADKFNGTPPLYFILGWLWHKAFNSSELSLRLFNSLGIAMAYVITWITLRRTYNFWSTTIGTLSIFSLSDIILYQNPEARMYGLFLAVCSLGLLQFDIINKKEECQRSMIYLNSLVNASIVQTHLYGIFYSGAILVAFIIRDKYFKTFRPKIYLSIVLSWLSLIPYMPSYLNQADAGNPHSWIPIPNLKVLAHTFYPSSLIVYVIFFLILISVCQSICKPNNTLNLGPARQLDSNSEISLLILACTFLGVPIFAWIISHLWRPIFVNRYVMSNMLVWSILMTYLTSRIILPISTSSKNPLKALANTSISILLTLFTLVLLIYPIWYAKKFPQQQFPGLADNIYGHKELPIAVERSHDFLKRFHYSPERAKYFFILDWQAALAKESGLFSPQEYKTMDALKRNYPSVFQDNIIQTEDFLKRYDSFLILAEKCISHDLMCPKWLEIRLRDNVNYAITPLGSIDGGDLLLVELKDMN